MEFKRPQFYRRDDLPSNIFHKDEDTGYANRLGQLNSQIALLEATGYKGFNGLYDSLVAKKMRLLKHIIGNSDDGEDENFDDNDPEPV